MECLVYTRVSSQRQLLGKSLLAQERICREFLQQNYPQLKLNISVIQEAASAFRQIPPFLKKAEDLQNGLFVCISVDRFSRNLEAGYKFASGLAEKGNKLIFIQDDVILFKNCPQSSVDKFQMKLYAAEEMSKILSRSVSNALNVRRDSDLDRKNIIAEFIHACRTSGSSVSNLNQILLQLSSEAFSHPIELFFEGRKVTYLHQMLSYNEIAGLLNAYGISSVEKWTDRNTARFYHQYFPIECGKGKFESEEVKPMEIDSVGE